MNLEGARVSQRNWSNWPGSISGESMGGTRDVRPCRSNFFNFHAIFDKVCQIVGWRPHLFSWHPFVREFLDPPPLIYYASGWRIRIMIHVRWSTSAQVDAIHSWQKFRLTTQLLMEVKITWIVDNPACYSHYKDSRHLTNLVWTTVLKWSLLPIVASCITHI